jgi:fermentation-respiration switch protein FrsA (DUF1100 family)
LFFAGRTPRVRVQGEHFMDWKRILIGKWSWQRPLVSLAWIYFLLLLTSCFFADRLIFAPPPPSYTASYLDLGFLKTSGNESIAYLHLPARKGMPTLLYSHGNAEDIVQSTIFYEELHARGLGVFAYDYPGYGLSTGTPNEDSCQRAILAAWNHLTDGGVAPPSIIITGRSVGGGPSVWLASRTKPAGLALISPFRSAFTAAIPTPFSIFPGDRFPNLERIRGLDLPLLVIHGEDDRVIAVSHGRKLYDASPSQDKKLVLIPNAGHNDLYAVAGDEVIEELDEFAKRIAK